MSKKSKLILLITLVLFMAILIVYLFFVQYLVWYIFGSFLNILCFIILMSLEKKKKITGGQLAFNILLRQAIYIIGVLIIFFITKHDQNLMLYSFIAYIIGISLVKVSIYTHRLIERGNKNGSH